MLVLIALCGIDGSAVQWRPHVAPMQGCRSLGAGRQCSSPLVFGRSVHTIQTISTRGAGYICPSHCYLPPPPGFSDFPTALQCTPSVSMVLFEKNNQPADYFSVHFIKSLEFFQSWQGSLFFVTKMHAQSKSLQQRILLLSLLHTYS